MRRNKLVILVFIFLLFNILIIGFSSALNANFTNLTGSVERAFGSISTTNIINFTIGAMSENITQVTFVLAGFQSFDPDRFISNSNGTSAASTTFINSSTANSVILTFANTTAAGIIQNGTTRNFWFNINSRGMASSLMTVVANATGISRTTNATSTNFGFTFRFTGYVKNETGGFHNSTNVTVYQFTVVPNSPPIETALQSVLSDVNGSFTISGISAAGGNMYTMKMIYYNESGTATKVGTTLPPFPAEMYYPAVFGEGEAPEFEFMKPPSLNGSTFFLGPAATINITAINNTGTFQRFGYMVMDQKTGLDISSNIFGNVSSVRVVVPINKRYTAMAVRINSQFANGPNCNGGFMDSTNCSTPPKANSTINPTTAGQQVDVQINLAVSRVQMYGCIGVSGNSTPITNITSILPKLLPWEGFVPPMRPDTQDINLTNTAQLNISDSRCSGKIAWYNISLLNSNYLVEFYGKNASTENISEHVAAFQNVSYSGQSAGANIMQNITLGTLAGSFVANGDVNTTKLRINIQNSTGGAITQDTPHVDLFVRDPTSFGELTYIVDSLTNGTFYVTLPRNATAKAKIFSNSAPPKEKTLNLSLSEVNITLISMTGGDGGFRKINASGDLEAINITNTNFAIQMRFIKAGGNCDGLYPDNATCVLTSTAATGFNPLSALVAGTINMEMKMTSTNVSITFYNFDMFSAKQPPMESVMNDRASGGSANTPVWEFGSFVPADVYDYAIIAMPYSDSNINDSAQINMSMSNLYDENWNVIWNSSRGDTSANFTNNIDEYLGNANNRSYNSTGYRNFTISGGVRCSTTDSNLNGSTPSSYCFINTTLNIMYMRVPHFSGVGPLVTAVAPASSSSSDSSSTTGGGTGADSYWKITISITEVQVKNGYIRDLGERSRIVFSLGGASHSVGIISLTSNTIIINVSSTPQQAVLSIGESKKFEVTNDSYYDLLVKLNGINNSKANITIQGISEKIPETVPSNATIPTTTNTGNQQNNTTNTPETSKRDIKTILVIITIIIIAAIIISLLGYYIMIKRKRRLEGY